MVTKNVLFDGEFVSKVYINRLLKRDKAWYCSICNEYHHSCIDKFLYNDCNYCCQIHISRMCRCEKCGGYYTRGCLKRNNNGNYLCSGCLLLDKYDEKCRVNGYYFKNEVRYYVDKNMYVDNPDKFLGVGIELEVDRAGENNLNAEKTVKLLNDEVYIKHDGSLSNGFEIVTYPHTYNALMSMNWEDTMRELILMGYRSHDAVTCGLHMHISRGFFTDKGIQNLMYFYDRFRPQLLKFARRDSNQADRWANRWSNSRTKNDILNDEERLFNHYNMSRNHSARYRAVNIINPNTIEIRLMRGTLNYNTFKATCEFIFKTALNANNIKNVNSLKEWLSGLSDDCLKYMCSKNCFNFKEREKIERDADDEYMGDDLICV